MFNFKRFYTFILLLTYSSISSNFFTHRSQIVTFFFYLFSSNGFKPIPSQSLIKFHVKLPISY
ncbi:hypothetical protein AAZX31_08G335500 [Glycine max]